ncbi:hypothetical protein HYDPIDRAFT_169054 [Hydnomerulius pinastri MD-312]|uniref:Uncharacterized protein n=1 Tax=Hydnomerulius pinastri MD-312 TaxID=994086 RepID=A0A0C9WDT3_9AGAM|nr:hypothetical protein HYDPIDRAFT_169054 [Hydnomerulius pinastri MD-312]
MFMPFVLLLTSLAYLVSAVPLALRDVVDPPITSPTASSVWHVGDKQTVTWSTANLPSNPSNPNGMLVLGYMYNNSENLMLDSPLATNLNYAAGQAQITVPNVPTRQDYIVVLFGDSGNASPQFTITNDASSSAPPTTSTAPTTSTGTTPASSSPPASNSPSTSPNTPGTTSPVPASGYPTATAVPTATAPALDQSSVSTSSTTVVTLTASTSPSPTQTNAAWQKHAPGWGTSVGVVLALFCFAL